MQDKAYNLNMFNVESHEQSLGIMKGLCEKYYLDTVVMNKHRLSPEMLYRDAQSRYLREKTETFVRPSIFWTRGGDCDCQTIAATSYFLYKGLPEDQIFWMICGTDRITHIFPFFKVAGNPLYFDMLPERKYNTLFPYKMSKIFTYENIRSIF